MRDYLSTALASLITVGLLSVAANFGYEKEATALLVLVGLPLAFLVRYLRFGRNRKDDNGAE